MEIITLDLQFEQIRHDFIPLRHEIEKRLIDSDLLFKINEIRRYFFKAFKLIKQESNFIESKELIDQGIEHTVGSSFAPNPIYFNPKNIVKLAIESNCNALASTIGGLAMLSRKYAHKYLLS